jgi:hypothetical protein
MKKMFFVIIIGIFLVSTTYAESPITGTEINASIWKQYLKFNKDVKVYKIWGEGSDNLEGKKQVVEIELKAYYETNVFHIEDYAPKLSEFRLTKLNNMVIETEIYNFVQRLKEISNILPPENLHFWRWGGETEIEINGNVKKAFLIYRGIINEWYIPSIGLVKKKYEFQELDYGVKFKAELI